MVLSWKYFSFASKLWLRGKFKKFWEFVMLIFLKIMRCIINYFTWWFGNIYVWRNKSVKSDRYRCGPHLLNQTIKYTCNRFFSTSEMITLLDANVYSILYYNAVILLTPLLNEVHILWLLDFKDSFQDLFIVIIDPRI